MDKVRFGIVGCGVISPFHARAATSAEEVELVACCDIIPERAEKLAGDFNIPKVYTDYLEMMDSGEVDAVSVCVPSGLHSEITLAAAQRGKHVLCEKPIDITLACIDEMIAACKQNKVKLGVIFQRRTTPFWGKIKKVIDEGRLGKMVLGDVYLKYFRSQQYYDSGEWRGTWALDGGGALMNQGVHMIDILRWIMGPVDTIYAQAGHLARNIEVEDTACAVIKWASGAFGVLQGTTSVTPGQKHSVALHGEFGTIIVEGEGITQWSFPGSEDCDPRLEDDKMDKIGDSSADPKAIATMGHLIQMRDLCNAIKTDGTPMITGEEARKSVEMILAVYQSARTGEPVKLPLV